MSDKLSVFYVRALLAVTLLSLNACGDPDTANLPPSTQEPCKVDCDCAQGQLCSAGQCKDGAGALFCCARAASIVAGSSQPALSAWLTAIAHKVRHAMRASASRRLHLCTAAIRISAPSTRPAQTLRARPMSALQSVSSIATAPRAKPAPRPGSA